MRKSLESKNAKRKSSGDRNFVISVIAILLVVEVLSVLAAQPASDLGFVYPGDPQSVGTSWSIIVQILLITIVFLFLIKIRLGFLLKFVILFAIVVAILRFYFLFLPYDWVVLPALLTAIYWYRRPEWFVVNIVGVAVCIYVASMLGISLGIIPALALLIGLAVYDAISVYKTKHMVTLARGVIDSGLPLFFLIPKVKSFSFIKNKLKGRRAYIIGYGDIIIPTILVVSANFFLTAPKLWIFNLPALGAVIGSVFGLKSLVEVVQRQKGKPQAGLPLLNAGTIAGFLVGVLLSAIIDF